MVMLLSLSAVVAATDTAQESAQGGETIVPTSVATASPVSPDAPVSYSIDKLKEDISYYDTVLIKPLVRVMPSLRLQTQKYEPFNAIVAEAQKYATAANEDIETAKDHFEEGNYQDAYEAFQSSRVNGGISAHKIIQLINDWYEARRNGRDLPRLNFGSDFLSASTVGVPSSRPKTISPAVNVRDVNVRDTGAVKSAVAKRINAFKSRPIAGTNALSADGTDTINSVDVLQERIQKHIDKIGHAVETFNLYYENIGARYPELEQDKQYWEIGEKISQVRVQLSAAQFSLDSGELKEAWRSAKQAHKLLKTAFVEFRDLVKPFFTGQRPSRIDVVPDTYMPNPSDRSNGQNDSSEDNSTTTNG